MPLLGLFLAIPAAQGALIPALAVQTSSFADRILQPSSSSVSNALNQILSTTSGLIPQDLPPNPPSTFPSNLPAVSNAASPALPTSSNMLQPASAAVPSVPNLSLPASSQLQLALSVVSSVFGLSLPTSPILQPTVSVISKVFSNASPTPSDFLQPALNSVSSILKVNLPTSSGDLQPALKTMSSIVNEALPIPSGLIPPAVTSASAIANHMSLFPTGLNPLSLVSTYLPASSTLSSPAVKNVFNGINVQFPISSVPIASILASVTNNANLMLPTATGLLHAAMASILPTPSVLSLSTATSASTRGNRVFPTFCVDVFDIVSQALVSLPTTLITLQPACSPLSVYIGNLQPSSGLANASGQPSSGLPGSLSNELATVVSQVEGSATSLASSPARSSSPPLPCVTVNPLSAPTCSLVPGNVVPRNGLLPCGTCPTNAGLLGVDICPWLCSISFFEAGVYSCSPIDITGQTFPGSGALNITNHLAEAACHQCAAPCNIATSPTGALVLVTSSSSSSALSVPATTTSNDLYCTEMPSPAKAPCCEPYGTRGNLVCTSCPVDPAELAICPWLCRMPYVEGRIDVECSPIDLTGVSLFSPYNETVQCERCRPTCSSFSAATSAPICVLSTTVALPLTLAAPSALIAATTVTTRVPTCTNIGPGSPPVTCIGGPDFSTLFCPQGCPTLFTNQCTYFCTSTFGSAFGGLLPAMQCAPVDLSLISPGTISCQQCYPQCNGNFTGSSTGLSSGPSNSTSIPTATLGQTSIVASSPTCTIVSPSVVDPPASQDNNTGILFRSSCGISAATIAQCPYLCSHGGSAFFQECSNTDKSGKKAIGQFPPIVCTQCLPSCLNSSISSLGEALGRSVSEASNSLPATVASASPANSTKSLIFSYPSSTIALSSTPSVAPNGSSIASGLTNLSASPSLVSSSPAVNLSTFRAFSAGSATVMSSTATCTSVIPYGTDSSAIVEPNTGLLVRSSCGFTAETVAQCPFICSAGGGAPNGNCSTEDITGRLMYGSYPPMVCHQCLPPCQAVTTATAGPICSSVAPNAPDSSPLIDLSGILYRNSCGTSATTVAQCPYLCGLLGGTILSRQCFHQDLTNKTITGLLADVGLLTCEKCLPPCGNRALPSCTSDLFSEVTSLTGALPTKDLALVGPIEGRLHASMLPTSLVANIISQLPTSALPSLLNLILAKLPASGATPSMLNSAVAGLPTSEPVPFLVSSIAGALSTKVAAFPVVSLLATQLPSKVALPTSSVPAVITSIAAFLPAKAALPSLGALLQGGGLSPLSLAERDSVHVFERRDLVNDIVKGPSTTRLQLTCGNTTEAVAACPFLCSPMDGDTQSFRRCAAVDITNNFIGVNRVTCERCLPLCLNL